MFFQKDKNFTKIVKGLLRKERRTPLSFFRRGSGFNRFVRQHHFVLGFVLLAFVSAVLGASYSGMSKKIAKRPGSVMAANNWGGLAEPATTTENVKFHGGNPNPTFLENDIKLDSLNRPYIAWYDNSSGNYDIFFTHWDGTKWAQMNGAVGNENLSNNAILSWNPRIAIDSANRPYVVWYDSNSGLGTAYITHWDGTKWAKMNGTAGYEAVPNTFTGNPKIDLDSSDRPYIVWNGNVASNVGLTRWDGTNWVKLDGSVGYDTVYSGASDSAGSMEFELDSADKPNMVWRNNVTTQIVFTRWDGIKWAKMDGSAGYDNVSGYSGASDRMVAMALDATGKPNIVWADLISMVYTTKFTHWDGTKWATMAGAAGSETVGGATRPSIAMDYNNRPNLVWSVGAAGVSFTRWDGTKWATMLGAAGREIIVGSSSPSSQIRLDIDASNNPHIAWQTIGKVFYTHWIPSAAAALDIGLKYWDGTQAVSIAAEPLGTLTSPLRIFKAPNTYGIMLVDPADANASKIRINTSGGVKALKKISCTPDCAGKQCGAPDGCGGLCGSGTCPSGKFCTWGKVCTDYTGPCDEASCVCCPSLGNACSYFGSYRDSCDAANCTVPVCP